MSIKKFAALGFLGISALVLSACGLSYGSKSESASETVNVGSSQNSQSTSSGVGQNADNITIAFADGVVTPATSTVKSGGTITWMNNSSKAIKVSSDPHPTHTANPELTGGEFVTELAAGESSTVTVNKIGTWGFHDHMNPSTKGSVTVK